MRNSESVLIVGIVVLVILFAGDPDLMDAIIVYLKK